VPPEYRYSDPELKTLAEVIAPAEEKVKAMERRKIEAEQAKPQ